MGGAAACARAICARPDRGAIVARGVGSRSSVGRAQVARLLSKSILCCYVFTSILHAILLPSKLTTTTHRPLPNSSPLSSTRLSRNPPSPARRWLTAEVWCSPSCGYPLHHRTGPCGLIASPEAGAGLPVSSAVMSGTIAVR